MKKFSTIALCFLIVLAACRTSKKVTRESSTKEQKTDSISLKETAKLDTLKAPKESATVAFPFSLFKDSLLNYMEKSNGRAKVSVYRIRDTVFATADCDSLEKVILSKDRELFQWQQYAKDQITSKEKVIVDVPLWFKLLLIGIVAIGLGGIFLTIFLHFKKP